jgi:glucose-1-phosphate thymidylyltransferase
MGSGSLNKNNSDEVIGLIPAGGMANRIAPVPCSKELFPIGFRIDMRDGGTKIKVVSHYLLERMKSADIDKAYIILRKGKWDIPAYFGDGSILNMYLCYLIMGVPYGTPFTLNQAYPFIKDKRVALGFPDILFHPADAYRRIIARQEESGADIVLGLFSTDKKNKMDMVDFDESGRVKDIIIKPAETTLQYTWIVAVWTPRFTKFMYDYLNNEDTPGRELYVGDVILAALKKGLSVTSVLFEDGYALDIGTPEDLERALTESHKFNLH